MGSKIMPGGLNFFGSVERTVLEKAAGLQLLLARSVVMEARY